jgi:hypothetical protein
MFCPQCEAEYLPPIPRCSDCDMPLVEHLPVTHRDSDRKKVFGFAFFKENGALIGIPVVILATLLVPVTVGVDLLGIQIASIIFYTGSVFLHLFCDLGPGGWAARKGTKGFSLGEKAVRQKLSLLLRIHAGFLIVIIALVAGAARIGPHTWFLWHLDDAIFYPIVMLVGFAFLFAEIYMLRRILWRALEDEQRNDR